MNIQEVEALRQQINNTNERLVIAKTKIDSLKKRQQEILAQYGCSTFTDFQALLQVKEKEMDMLVQAAQKYLTEILPVLNQVEGLLNNAG